MKFLPIALTQAYANYGGCGVNNEEFLILLNLLVTKCTGYT